MKGRSRFRFRYRGIMGALAQALGSLFDKILNDEETAGNDNVFYNPQDLTSLRVGTNGSGGSPAVGDPVGMMLDTSGLAGSMEEFLASGLAGATELVTNGTFDTDTSGWSAKSGGIVTWVDGAMQLEVLDGDVNGGADQNVAVEAGKTYVLSFDVLSVSTSYYLIVSAGAIVPINISGLTATGSQKFVFVAPLASVNVSIYAQSPDSIGSDTLVVDNISIKEIPGNHAIAPSDAARPTLMDDPDTTWSSLTDDGTRGPELVTNGGFETGDLTGWTTGGTDANNTISVNASNSVDFVSDGSQPLALRQANLFELGVEHELTIDVTVNPSDVGGIKLQYAGLDSSIGIITSSGSYTFTFRPSNSILEIYRRNGAQVTDVTIDNISVRKVNTAFDERGGELVTNGTFDTDSDWTKGTGWTISGGQAILASGSTAVISQPFTTELGKSYLVELTVQKTGGYLRVDFAGVNTGLDYTNGTINYRKVVTSIDVNAGIIIQGGLGTADWQLDNVSVKEVPYPNLLLAANGSDDDSTFDTDTGNWARQTGWSIGSGVLSFSGTGNANASFPNLFTDEKWYQIKFYVSAISNCEIHGYIGSGTTPDAAIVATTTGWHSGIARKVSGTLNHVYISSRGVSGTGTATVDNIIIQELPSTTPTSYYLDCDGTDDWMQVTPTLNLGEQWWHTGAWKCDVAGIAAFATTNDFRGRLFALSGGQGWNYRTADDGNAEIVDGDIFQKHIATVEKSDTNSINGRYNGGPATIITPYDTSAQTQGLALFTQYNLGPSIPLNGRFYGGAWGQGQVDYAELTTLQDYLGTLVEPDIDPTDVTSYANVYEMLSAQTAAALFDIDDTTSLRVGRDGSGGVPVDGDPVGLMMDVSGAGGSTMGAYLEGAAEVFSDWLTESAWTAYNAGVVFTGSSLEFDATSDRVAHSSLLSSGQWYQLTANGSGSAILSFDDDGVGAGVGVNTIYTSTAGVFPVNAIFQTTTSPRLRIVQGGSGSASITSLSIKALPGYVATAPSDAARPTLASVLDETASELTDDGTRGAETITTSYPATFVSQACGLLNSAAMEVGELYEITWDVASTDGSITLFLVDSAFGGSFAYQVLTYSAGTGSVVARCNAKSINGVYVNGTATINSISVKKIQTVFDGRGDELVTNGGFDDASNWTFGGGGVWTISGGVASVDSTSTSPTLDQNIGAGNKYYEVTLDVVSTNGTGILEVYHINLGPTASFDILTTGTKTVRLFGGTSPSNGRLSIRARGGFIGSIDNISVKEVLTPNLLLTSAGDDDSTFDTDTGNWTKGTGWTISGGVLSATGVTFASSNYLNILEINKWYRVRVYVSAISGSWFNMGDSGTQGLTQFTTTGWKEQIWQAGATTFRIYGGNGITATIDNVIIQEVPASVARAFYLDFDGVDDNLILPGTDFGSSTNATLYKTFRGDSTDNQHILFGPNGGSYILVAQAGGATPVSDIVGSPVYRQNGIISSYATRNDVHTTLMDNTDHTIGVEEANLAVSGAWTTSGFYIGGEFSSAWNLKGRLYSWAAVDTRLDGRNRDLLENFMISKKTS